MKRFISFRERNFVSLIGNFNSNFIEIYMKIIKNSKWKNLKWKSLTLMKDPMSLSIYLQLLQDIKPKTILEFGTYEGGSALWLSDMTKSLNYKCKIYTFDINEKNVKIKNNKDIIFYKLDNYLIKDFIKKNEKIFLNMKKPVLVIEDSHENFFELISEIDKYLSKGDYLIIEDTLYEPKHIEMYNFLENNKYLIDTKYCDFWGLNNSWNINSFLKKIKN